MCNFDNEVDGDPERLFEEVEKSKTPLEAIGNFMFALGAELAMLDDEIDHYERWHYEAVAKNRPGTEIAAHENKICAAKQSKRTMERNYEKLRIIRDMMKAYPA